MRHPIIVRTSSIEDSITVQGERLRRLLEKPKPIMWKHGEEYLWVPIEVVRDAIRDYKRCQIEMFPPPKWIRFVRDDCTEIPKEAGAVIDKYNGHEEE